MRVKDETRWGWELLVCSLLLCIALAVVYGTEARALGMWFVCLWAGHHVTAWIWIRRLRKIKRAAEVIATNSQGKAEPQPPSTAK